MLWPPISKTKTPFASERMMKMTDKTEHALRLTRVIAADPETVFGAWTEPEHMKLWSAPEGMDVPLVEVDPAVAQLRCRCVANLLFV